MDVHLGLDSILIIGIIFNSVLIVGIAMLIIMSKSASTDLAHLKRLFDRLDERIGLIEKFLFTKIGSVGNGN